MRVIRNLAIAVVLGLVPLTAMGASDDDLVIRMKIGSAAQIDHGAIGTDSGPIAGEQSSNAQFEFLFSHYVNPVMSAIIGAGYFSRQHSGSENIGVGFGSTTFDYDAKGYTIVGGMGFKASENARWEARIELGMGEGKPSLSTPGFSWNNTDSGTYTSTSVIVGGYYAFSKPGLELGLELGSQTFDGDWKIWSNNGYWMDSNVKGSSSIINFIFGYRF